MHPYLAQLLAKERRERFLAEAARDRSLAGLRRRRRRRLYSRLADPVARARGRDRTARPEAEPDLRQPCPGLECP